MLGNMRSRRDSLALRDGLPRLLADLRETATVAQLAEAILTRTERGVQASRGALVIDGAVKGVFGLAVEEAEAGQADEALFPVRIALAAEYSDLDGWLLVGPRADGSRYPRGARQALERVADPAARALAIVLHRERAATEQHWLLHSLDVRLTRLETMLAAKN
jgi:hypothetical protein